MGATRRSEEHTGGAQCAARGIIDGPFEIARVVDQTAAGGSERSFVATGE